MRSLIVEYTLYGSPKVQYINVVKSDLVGNSTILDQICAWHKYPQSASSEIRILDLIPSD